MPYGTIKVDNVIFTNAGVDQTIAVSGIVSSISGNLTVTGTISGATVRGGTLVSGATVTGGAGQFGTLTGNTAGFTTVTGTTVTGTTANFVSGVFTTQLSGAIITGNTIQGTNITGGAGGFTSITGTTVTGTTANFVSGVFTTQVSGATVRGNLALFNSGNFASGLITTGIIQSTTGGFRFPDGTTQTTAASAGGVTTTGVNTFTAAQRGAVVVATFSTGIALDFSASNNFQITLTGNTTLQNPTNVASGQAGVITIIQGTGNNTMAFGSNWNYPGGSGSVPALTTTSGAVDLLVYYTRNTTNIGYRLIQDVKA